MDSVARVDPYGYGIDVASYRSADHSWLAELDDQTVHAGRPYQRMGTRTIPEDEWFRVDSHVRSELDLKRRLLAEAPREVFAALDGSEAPCIEAAELVAEWLRTFAHAPAVALDDRVVSTATVAHPLQQAALAVQDDLCIMQRDERGWRLTAAVLCFPTYWRLSDKLGKAQEQIHEPVPHFAEDLSAKVSRFFDGMRPDRIVCRRNWGFSAHPLLFVPDLADLAQPEGFDPSHVWLRSERQTLRRLARTGAILFAIRVQLAPSEALVAYPGVAARLAQAMDAWSPELATSRGSRHGWLAEVAAWLRGVGSVSRS